MKKIQTFIYVLLMGVCFAACQEDDFGGSAQGGIRIALADGTADVDVTTRSTPSELFDGFKEKFKFQIKGDNYDQTHNWTNDVIPLAAGVYDITATCGTEQAEGVVKFDAPCYKGTKEGQKVNAGETATEVSISCEITNALVSIKFGGEYKEFAEKAYAMITVGSGTETKWAKLSESAYFKAGSSLSKLKIFKDDSDSNGADILTDAQKDADFPKTFKAGDHLIITLSVAKKDGNVAFKVSKVELKEVTIEETIPLEWLPKPSVSATGFDSNNSLTFAETETEEAKLDLTLASAMQDMRLKFNFSDAQFTSLNRDTGYLWSNTQDKEIIVNTLGINVSDNSVDLNGLLAKLQTNAGAATTNTIEVDVKANNRWSSEDENANRTYTIICNKPQFSIAVQPGNVWTKTFTIDEPTVTTGNADALKEKLVYQYKEKDADDNAWRTCSDGLEQVFSKVPSNKSYQVRAFYREGIASNVVDVTLETPAQLPNSNMEDWWIETKKKSNTWPFDDKTYYTFHPYAEGEGNSSWWDTNNDKAQGGTVIANIWYEGCFASCVSYTTDVHGGSKAALIYLSGCGDGYANTSGSYVGGAMIGSLFIGSYNSGIVQGHSFDSRPTSLSFWYKYKPYNSDAFKVVVSLKNGDTEIATGTYEPSAYSTEDNAYTQATVNFNYTDNTAKATTICVQFLASNKTSLSGSDFAWGTNINYPTIGDWTVHMGSVLKIDDLCLNYDK